jgi:hypothetical protein
MSASNANAIEPSSKPGNVDAVAGGSDSRRAGGGGGGSQLLFNIGVEVRAAAGGITAESGPGGALALASAAAPVPFAGSGGFAGGRGAGGAASLPCEEGSGTTPGFAGFIGEVIGCFALVGTAALVAVTTRGTGETGSGTAGFAAEPTPVARLDGGPGRAGAGATTAGAGATTAMGGGTTAGEPSGRTAAMRVESMRTAAISVDPSVERE